LQKSLDLMQIGSMAKNHDYVLGINAYDHDVSACLLRDGEIAYAIEKERITRIKHAGGFFQEAVDYCLQAEDITLDDVDLVVRNCYVLPVEDFEVRLIYQGDVPERERAQMAQSALHLPKSNKVVTVSHHLAHAYSAFAVCPFDEGVVMIVDGVGSYSSDIKEPGQLTEGVNPLARIRELLPIQGQRAHDPEEDMAGALPRHVERRVLQHGRARRALQPGVELYFRRLEQVRRGHGARALRPAQ
jgi:Carbamoyltransferase N-terminus